MFDEFEMLTIKELNKIYEFTYNISYELTGKELKGFITAYYDLLSKSDYKRVCGIEVLLKDIMKNTYSKRTKNKISKFLKSIPENVVTINPKKYKVINYK